MPDVEVEVDEEVAVEAQDEAVHLRMDSLECLVCHSCLSHSPSPCHRTPTRNPNSGDQIDHLKIARPPHWSLPIYRTNICPYLRYANTFRSLVKLPISLSRENRNEPCCHLGPIGKHIKLGSRMLPSSGLVMSRSSGTVLDPDRETLDNKRWTQVEVSWRI